MALLKTKPMNWLALESTKQFSKFQFCLRAAWKTLFLLTNNELGCVLLNFNL